MRRFAVLSFALLMCALTVSAEETKARSFVARSAHYEMTLTVEPLPSGQVAYEARVKDLVSQTVVAQRRATAPPATDVDLSSESDGLKFVIHLHPSPMSLAAILEVERDGAVVETLGAGLNLPAAANHLNAPGAMRVGGDVKAPVVLTRVDPIYPEIARKDRIAGIVIVEVLIDKTGTVADAIVLKNLPDGLGDAAVDAVKQWKFQPGTMNGEPVDVIFNLTVNFRP